MVSAASGIGCACACAAIVIDSRAADSQYSGLNIARPRAHNAAIETLRNATRN